MTRFIADNPDYPVSISMLQIEACEVSDTDIPSGSGGINGEGYSYGQLRHHPIIPELKNKISHPVVRSYIEECNMRNSSHGFQMYRVNGEYCFWGLRLGPVVKSPSASQLKQILLSQSSTAPAVRNKCVTTEMIRNITYAILREAIAKECRISINEASSVIGNQLDCVPHEDEATELVFMVPNWAHKWFRHNGYASHMCHILNSND